MHTRLFLLLGSAAVCGGLLCGCSRQKASSENASTQPVEPKSAVFKMTHAFIIKPPEGATEIRAWLAMPQRDDPAQTVADFKVESSYPYKIVRDDQGNEYVYVEILAPSDAEIPVTQTFTITRQEVRSEADPENTQPLTAAEREQFAADLAPNTYVIIDDRIRSLAAGITGDEKNPVRAARLIYDWMLENIEYWVKDPANLAASSMGSTEHCLTTKTGNCTDFHSLWASLARASGIPTRIVYGSLAKPSLDGADHDQSYHCWPEFYAPQIGWIAHDVAVADIYHGEFSLNEANSSKVELTTAFGYQGPDAELVDYYFGNLDERRVVWNRGRDLNMLNPPQSGGPINAMPKAHVEVDGEPWNDPANWTRTLTYTEVKS
ncbi:MAG TPA: transglutaminase domain-containing protein [Verrucomicrobiales bacterium]|nr:transglutaminase domain-containing protein [Verrucomicrobiales bacterium]